ncbi:Disease resistance protein [Corchorus olitorius]|uniref:Disease resistance protein n=1 Tax=Corchorus olitorius TaxID=93759 RepID=A0A1R3J134_9ROSI|nr:Disease resistance protein [Corchorus olitorius]
MRLLSMESPDVRILGIYGMGGIGKTTIAKAVYNSVCDGFDGSSFLSDIKDNSKQPNGLATIQQQLLSDILNMKGMITIDNVDRGINLIRERLCYRTVFIVLDDVDDSTQLKSLVGDRKWFGLGSRIIVTTRDERLLTEIEVDRRYKVESLNLGESIKLFSWHAFRRPAPKDDYLQLSKSVLDHVQGLPLALEVLGSFLFKRSQLEWKSVVEKLRQIPHDQIQSKLRISFDSLDDQLKAIFLDIACFFIGMEKEYVMTILNGCGFFSVIGISVLVERSLLTIGQYDNKIQMHDLLRDMGREIVREMSPNQIGKRSRLWFHQDVVNVLRNHTGSKAVEGVSLDVSAKEDAIVLRTEAFAKMMNLRLLKINSVYFSTTCYDKFSKELRWLCWHRCSLQVLPPNLDLDSLVVLDMRFSNLKSVWKGIKLLDKLEILDLSYSIYLVETPNFCRCNSLKILQLEGCTSLTKVHQSIGNLERLVFLNFAKCNSLRELPDNICNLTSLETLNLNGCSKLSSLPGHLCKLKALRDLFADGSAITELPTSIGHLKNLENLSLAGLKEPLPSTSWLSFFSSWVSPKSATFSSLLLPATFIHLTSLRELNLRDRNLRDNEIAIDFRSFQFLKDLNLGGNNFCKLPAGINDHPTLKELKLSDCRNLQSIEEIPPNLKFFEAQQCRSTERYPNLAIPHHHHLFHIFITNCCTTIDLQGWNVRRMSRNRGSVGWWAYTYRNNDLEELRFQSKWKYLEACFPARKVPDWFDYNQVGSTVLFCMPSTPIGQFRAMIICVIMHPVNEEYCEDQERTLPFLILSLKNKTKGSETFDKSRKKSSFDADWKICKDHAWVAYLNPHIFYYMITDEGDEIEVSIEPQGGILVKECGIHLPIHENWD